MFGVSRWGHEKINKISLFCGHLLQVLSALTSCTSARRSSLACLRRALISHVHSALTSCTSCPRSPLVRPLRAQLLPLASCTSSLRSPFARPLSAHLLLVSLALSSCASSPLSPRRTSFPRSPFAPAYSLLPRPLHAHFLHVFSALTSCTSSPRYI